MRTIFITLFAAAAGCGCATQAVKPPDEHRPDLFNPGIVAGLVTESIDDYKKQKKFTGPDLANLPGRLLLLRAVFFQTGRPLYQVYVKDQYEGQWRHYSEAHDISGTRLKFVPVAKTVESCRGGCLMSEEVAITIDRAYLDAAANANGMYFKVSGQGGSQEYHLPRPYIVGFLDRAREQ